MNAAATFATKVLGCKLTTPELRKRKTEVLSSLKAKMTERIELEDGFQYSFAGSDTILEEIIQFIKTERACCTFFSFQVIVKDEDSPIMLQITGPEGAKQFIVSELEW
ncbi:MAG TPA: hypothetical protein VGN63_00255 [Flavisolibacter sp.]|nr:hypothetical protein [Flavisolibacter sp.]